MTTTTHAGVAAAQKLAARDWAITVEEYEFMRGTMGRDHREACALIGTTTDSFWARARTWGYQYMP